MRERGIAVSAHGSDEAEDEARDTPKSRCRSGPAAVFVAVSVLAILVSGCPDCRTTSPPPTGEQPSASERASKRSQFAASANGRGETGTESAEASVGGTRAPDPTANDELIRILALGNSYTAATGVEDEERWPNVVVERLRADGHGVAPPELVATGGWTTRQLLNGLDAASLEGGFDAVLILIGTNDAMLGVPHDRYREEFGRLLDRAVEFAGGDPARVVALTLPDYSVTPAGERIGVEKAKRDVRTFNEIIRDEAAATEVRIVDIAPISSRIDERPELLADALHPGPEIHAAWAERTHETVASIVTRD